MQNDQLAKVVLDRFWKRNERRIEDWIKEKIEFYDYQDTPEFDDFFTEFEVESDSRIAIMYHFEDHLDYLDSYVIGKIVNGLWKKFERLVDELSEELEVAS